MNDQLRIAKRLLEEKGYEVSFDRDSFISKSEDKIADFDIAVDDIRDYFPTTPSDERDEYLDDLESLRDDLYKFMSNLEDMEELSDEDYEYLDKLASDVMHKIDTADNIECEDDLRYKDPYKEVGMSRSDFM